LIVIEPEFGPTVPGTNLSRPRLPSSWISLFGFPVIFPCFPLPFFSPRPHPFYPVSPLYFSFFLLCTPPPRVSRRAEFFFGDMFRDFPPLLISSFRGFYLRSVLTPSLTRVFYEQVPRHVFFFHCPPPPPFCTLFHGRRWMRILRQPDRI